MRDSKPKPTLHAVQAHALETPQQGGVSRTGLADWNPPFCGDMDMRVESDGQWIHEGRPILRPELVALFASILRREDDGAYYLVTPVEKVRITVDLHPLIITDFDNVGTAEKPLLLLHLNVGVSIALDRTRTLRLESRAEGAAFVPLDNGLSAIFSRAAWTRLAATVDASGCIESDGVVFSLIS